jgi:hypothetical protein
VTSDSASVRDAWPSGSERASDRQCALVGAETLVLELEIADNKQFDKHFCLEAYVNTNATYTDTVQELLKCIAPHGCRKAINIFWSVYADVAPEQSARSRGAAKD